MESGPVLDSAVDLWRSHCSRSRSGFRRAFYPNSRQSRVVFAAAFVHVNFSGDAALCSHLQARVKTMHASISLGIDVAKAHLDAHLLPDNKRLRVTNDSAGREKLVRFVKSVRPDRVVLESTGGYERAILHRLVDAGVATALINPAEARAFARANRSWCKNDPKDAWLLAQVGRRVG